jgi:hypothetical protein
MEKSLKDAELAYGQLDFVKLSMNIRLLRRPGYLHKKTSLFAEIFLVTF